MTAINHETLKQLRKRKNWSLDKLAEESEMNKSTIHRIEQGKQPSRGHRPLTISNLAKALGCTPEQFTSPPDQGEGDTLSLGRRSSPRLKMSNAAQNALQLVAMRFGIGAEEILDFAPLLFEIIAMESLIERKARLKALWEQQAAVSELSRNFPHLSDQLFSLGFEANEIEEVEDKSIKSFDIKGDMIAEAGYDPEPGYRDLGHYNPFMLFLRDRVERIAGKASGWCGEVMDWALWPEYRICEDLATAYASGDEQIAHGLLDGWAKIADLPTSLRGGEKVSERLEWFRERIETDRAAGRAEMERFTSGLLAELGIPQEKPEISEAGGAE